MYTLIIYLFLFLYVSVRADATGQSAGPSSPAAPTSLPLTPTNDGSSSDGGNGDMNPPTVTVTVQATTTEYIGTWLLPASVTEGEELALDMTAEPTVTETVYETTTESMGIWYVTNSDGFSGSTPTPMTPSTLSEITTTSASYGVNESVMSFAGSPTPPTSLSSFIYPSIFGASNSSRPSSAMAAVSSMTTGNSSLSAAAQNTTSSTAYADIEIVYVTDTQLETAPPPLTSTLDEIRPRPRTPSMTRIVQRLGIRQPPPPHPAKRD
ncbi:hypothetical protein AOQ84DRAFT_769, partial [Glonium stellatum]